MAVSSLRTQEDVIAAQTVRERLLATIGAFFARPGAGAVGRRPVRRGRLPGRQRRRDIGICLALGAPTAYVARLVVRGVAAMACWAAASGCARASARSGI